MGQPTSTQRDTSASASSSSSSALTPRGPDVQRSFAIKSSGLQVLLDEQELEPGHIIHSQIKASSASATATVSATASVSASSSSSSYSQIKASSASASVSATASASSSSSSSASTPNGPYQVFINHRGPDVKKSFASFVYRELKSRGLQVFLDQQELEPGHIILSQLEEAIQSASVQIAIFSKTYAESKWCLDELVHMLETTRRRTISQRATILPVFYEVKPSELRGTDRGAYANAMRKHKQRYNLETIEKWKKALSDVAGISGFELEACNGDAEVELVRKVVQRVLEEVTYQVFINHRGPDVKKSFASSLYRELKSRGLQVFLDQFELKPGHPIFSQIEAAIQSASVQIAIFSKNYAQSKWCLEELVDMLETTRRDPISQRATILPVFYKVKPSELRRTDTGAYADAMRKHEQRCNLETIGKWKKALCDAAGISGFELEACKGDEVALVRKVVQRVLKGVPCYISNCDKRYKKRPIELLNWNC